MRNELRTITHLRRAIAPSLRARRNRDSSLRRYGDQLAQRSVGQKPSASADVQSLKASAFYLNRRARLLILIGIIGTAAIGLDTTDMIAM